MTPCCAQTSTTSSDPGQQPGTSQQPPQNPLQEPANQTSTTSSDPGQQPGTTQQPPQNPTQEPAKQPKSQPSSLAVGKGATTSKDQQVGEVRLMTRYTQLNGDTTRSFKVQGENNLAEFNYFLDRGFRGARRLQVLSMYRGTDDRSIDPEHNSLQRAYLRLYGPRDEYIIGDALVYYSRLSFNQNIRGLSASWKLGQDWKLSVLGGVFIDRWGSLWKDIPGRPYLATASGARLERRFMRDSTAGLNFSYSRDHPGTLPAAPVGTPPFPANNRVISIDTKMETKFGLRLESEYAWSFTDFDIRQSSNCVTSCDSRSPQPQLGTQSDWAARIEASYRHRKLTLRGSYSRFEPNFASINARQIADLQDFVFRTSYDLTNWLTLDGTLRRSNDDLRQQLPFGRRLWGPEARFILHDLPLYRRAVLEAGYRYRNVLGEAPTVPPTCVAKPGGVGSTCVDNFVRIPFAELTLPYRRTTFFLIGYERRHAVDHLDISQTSDTNRVYVSLRGIYDFGGWHFNPALRWELERQSHRPRSTSPVPDFTLDRDSNRLGSAVLYAEAPRWFIVELAFRDASATIFGPAGYSRPSYRTALTYKIRNDRNILLIFSFERNSNFYFTSPNFDERQFGMTFVYKFGTRK